MKIVVITDLFIPIDFIKNAFKIFKVYKFEADFLEWKLPNIKKLEEINLLIENI